MKRQTVACVLGFFLTSAAGFVGCGDDGNKGKPDALPGLGGAPGTGGILGGTGGRSGTGGTGGRTTTGTGGATTTPPDGGVPDAVPDGGDSDVPVSTDVAADTTPGTDTPADMAPTPDVAPPVDTGAGIMITACAQIDCPALMGPAALCNASAQDCEQESATSGGTTTVKYCFDNNVKKLSTRTSGMSVIQVKKPDGSACYTVENAYAATGSNVETWTYKDPAGTVIGSAKVNTSSHVFTLTCNGATYIFDTDILDCAATDGEPGDNDCGTDGCDIP